MILANTILEAWLLADFITGLVHWWQDHYLDSQSQYEFFNIISRDNDLHHSDPMAMTRTSLWSNINTSIFPAWFFAIIFLSIGASQVIWLAFIFAAFANVIHRWGHIPPRNLNWLIRFMQWTGLFITGKHHIAHHYNALGVIKKEDTKTKFCPMTNWTNPILDKIKFFYFLESVLRKLNIRTTKERNG